MIPYLRTVLGYFAFFTLIDTLFGFDLGLVGNVTFGFGCGLCWSVWKPLWKEWVGE